MSKSRPSKSRRPPLTPKPQAPELELSQLQERNDWRGLVAECRRRLAHSPTDRLSHRLLGFGLYMEGRFKESQSAYEQALQVHPDDTETLVNFGKILIDRVQPQAAIPLVERACRLRPDQASPWLLKAFCCHLLWRHHEGLAAAREALAVATTAQDRASALNMRAIHRRELGQTEEAIEDCRASIALHPDELRYRGNYMLFLLTARGLTPQRMHDAAREQAAAIEAAVSPALQNFARPASGGQRRLRVGFLSPDFRVHAVMHFLEPLLARLDRSQFEVWSLYLMHQDDQVTERARQLSDHFLSVADLSVEECVHKLRSLELDIVIDVAGHTAFNGLPVLAAKVAPVQVSWLGFPATTGMESVQYRITDPVSDPHGADRWYTEKLHRLDGYFCCYRPMIRQPLKRYQQEYEVAPTPALRNGYVTFGSCNNLAKLTDEVLALWSNILKRVPESRLLIEGKDLGKPDFAAQFEARCQAVGIDRDRLVLVGLHPDNQYLTYHRIDIALDPFPFSGGTTSCDTLWMGVPLVTLAGELFSSRMGTGLLTVMGRSEWIAQDAQQYEAIAADLASDVQRLNEIRMTVRPDMEQSPAMDEARFASEFGRALRQMWRQNAAFDDFAALNVATMATSADDAAPTTAQNQSLEAALQTGGRPEACDGAEEDVRPEIQVVMDQGRMSLGQAYAELQRGLEQAMTCRPSAMPARHDMLKPEWCAVTDDAKLLMATLPGDPMALAVLAEVELAHGNPSAAQHYLNWATRKLTRHEALR
jgi:protein O-GlcNAc transferase